MRNQMKSVWFLLAVMVALFSLPQLSFAEKVVVYSGLYPPYQIDDNGKLTGVNTEIVRAIFHQSGIPFEIQYIPWARAQKIVGDDSVANTAIYCLGRNEQRERHYKWVGVYFYQKVGFLTLKDSGVKINGPDDARNFVTGLVRGDIMTEQLTSQGYIGKHEVVHDDILNIKKLFKKRVQMIVTSLFAARYIAREIGFDPDQIESQCDVATVEFNLAVSKRTSDEICLKLQRSLKTLLESGAIDRIINNWR